MSDMNNAWIMLRSRTRSLLTHKRAVIVMGTLVTAMTAHAEIQRVDVPGATKFGTSVVMPKLPSLAGWHQHMMRSFDDKANVLVPDDAAQAGAETTLYAKAILKSRNPDLTTIDVLIARDKQDFAEHVPGVTIQEAPPIATADGNTLKSVAYLASAAKDWERVAYGEEGEFYLVFSVSSRSKAGFDSAQRAFEQLIGQYKEKP